jgi:hypothetical protein
MNIDEIERLVMLIGQTEDKDVKKILKDYLYQKCTLVCLPEIHPIFDYGNYGTRPSKAKEMGI